MLDSSFPLAVYFTHGGAYIVSAALPFIPPSPSLAVSSSLFSTYGQVLLFVALVLSFTSREQPTEQRVRDEQSRKHRLPQEEKTAVQMSVEARGTAWELGRGDHMRSHEQFGFFLGQ